MEDNGVEKNGDVEQEETDGPGGDMEGTTMTVLGSPWKETKEVATGRWCGITRIICVVMVVLAHAPDHY